MKFNSKSLLVLTAGAILSLASCSTDRAQSSSQPSSKEATTSSQKQSSEQVTSEQKSSEQKSSEQQTSEQATSSQQQSSEQGTSAEEISSSESATSEETTSEEPAPVYYTISLLENELVDLSVDKTEAVEKELVKVTATPKNEKVVIDAIFVNGVPLNEAELETGFVMPAENVTVAAQAHEKNDITITQIDGVVLSADKNYADEGEIVNVTAVYDKDKVDFECIKAGDIVLGENEDGSYYFVMPNHAVDLQAVASIGFVHSITCEMNVGSASIDVNSAREGDIVTFTISVLNGFNFIGVSIEDIDLIDHYDGTFSFVMPGHPVNVQIELEEAEFQLVYNDPHIRGVTYNAGTVDEPEWVDPDGIGGNFFKFNAQIRVEIKDTDIDQVVGLLLGGAHPVHVAREANSNFIYFAMPSYKVTLGVELQELLHQFVVNDDAALHFNFHFFRKNEAGEYVPTSGASIYEETYLKFEILDGYNPDNYAIRSLLLSFKFYTNNDTNLETRTINLLKTSTWSKGMNADGYYAFTLCVSTGEHMVVSGDDSNVTLTAVEKDLTVYAGKSWVGSYKGIEAYGTRSGTTFNDSYSPTIDGAGDFKLGGTDYNVLFDVGINKTLYIGQAGSKDPKGIALYSDKLIASHYNIDPSLFPTSGSANLFIAVNIPANANADDYGVFYDSFKVDSAQYIVAEFTYKGDFYAAAFADVAQGTLRLDAQITMLTGENILADGATYTITAGDLTLGGFGYKDDQHFLLDGKQGTYNVVDSDKTMHFDGINEATYDGKTWDYVFGQDGKATLTYAEMGLYGRTITTMVVSLNGNVATIESTDTGDVMTHEINLFTQNVKPKYSKTRYGWTLTGENAYEASNSGIHSSIAEMSVTCFAKGTLSFDYFVSSEVNADFFGVYRNGDQVGKTYSGQSSSGKLYVPVDPGDIVSLVFSKDDANNKFQDKATVSNIAFDYRFADAFQGEYALDNDSTATLDGFGNAVVNGKEFEYEVPESGSEIVFEYDDNLIENDGITPIHVAITVNKDTKLGTVVTTPTGEKQSFIIDNTTLDDDLELSSLDSEFQQPKYHFIDNGDGSYTSGNKGKSMSTAEMTIVAYNTGTVSFHLAGGGENNNDITQVFLNGVAIETLTTLDYGDNVDLAIDVVPGDRIQICFLKDRGTDKGADSVTVSNIVFTPASSEPEALTVNVNIQIPDIWGIESFYDADAVVFAYLFGGDYETPVWLPTVKGEGGVVTFDLEEGKTPEAFIIVRCAPGTEQGSFNEEFWNKTVDITYVQGQLVYNADVFEN